MRWLMLALLSAVSYNSMAVAQPITDTDQAPQADAQLPTAGSELINFNVSSGRLSVVLKRIAEQARASITVDRAAAKVQGRAVIGQMTLQQALEQALEGTGWRLTASAPGVLRLTRATDDERIDGDIVVIARRTDFAKTESSLLTRTNTPLRQTPATIDSVTEEVIRSQNLMTVAEALRNIPGTLAQNQASTQIIVGGQTTGGQTFSDGLRASLQTGNAPITDVESIEVLKGVASILTGTQVAGAVVNYVPKKANGAANYLLSAGGGTGGEFLTTFDVGNAIVKSAGLNYRMTGQVVRADHRPNGGNDPHSYAYGAMLGLRGDTLDADLGFQIYETRDAISDWYSYDAATGKYTAYGDLISPDSNNTTSSKKLNWGLTKTFTKSDDFTLQFRTRGLYQVAKGSTAAQVPTAYNYLGLFTISQNTLTRDSDKVLSMYADLFAQFETGALKHKLIFAGDLSRSRDHLRGVVTVNFGTTGYPLLTEDAFTIPPPGAFLNDTTIRQDQYGIVVQDQIDLKPLHFLFGIRKSWYDGDYNVNGLPANVTTSNFLPSGGVVLDISRALSIYGSYREGFSPVSPFAQRTFDGSVLPPITRKSWEVGFKSGFFDDRLTINGSYNRYTTVNDVLPDLAHPGFYISGPGTKGDVFEISVAGSITRSLKILSGYVYQKTQERDGRPVLGIPRHIANFWAIQTFNLGDRKSLDIGLGGNYSSAALSQSALSYLSPAIPLDDALTFRASAGFTLDRTKFNLTVDNIFDKVNYEPATIQEGVIRAAPRVIRFVVSQAF